MTSPWQPFREPLGTTLLRTGTIAVVAGSVIAWRWGGFGHWPVAVLMVLWFSFGGHWVELWFLNWLRPRLSVARPVQVAARIAVWFFAGAGLALGALLTGRILAGLRLAPWSAWWLGGFAFMLVELVMHVLPQLRGSASFYNGRG